MKNEVKALWESCFQDSKEFVNLYFEKRYKDDITEVIRKNGHIIAALQMVPYPMTFCSELISTSYISGACTHEEYRNKGVMKELLENTLSKMFNEKVLISTLIPAETWLFNYYRKFGYENTFNYSLIEKEIIPFFYENKYMVNSNLSSLNNIYDYFNKEMMKRNCSIQHTKEDFELIVKDLELSGGKVFIAWDKNKIKGVAFCLPESNTILVKEILADSEEVKRNILQTATEVFETEKLKIISYPFPNNNYNFGMGRIINAYEVLRLYAKSYPDKQIHFKLSDDIIENNQGYYRLFQGECIKNSSSKEKSYTELTINQLTKLLMNGVFSGMPKEFQSFNDQQPYMSLMLD